MSMCTGRHFLRRLDQSSGPALRAMHVPTLDHCGPEPGFQVLAVVEFLKGRDA